MSEQINLIKELLNHFDAYQQTTSNINISDFSRFLNQQVLQKNNTKESFKVESNFEKENYNNFKQYTEVEFSTLLTNLYRFAKHYIKKAFQDSELRTIDEFGFLATLLRQKSLLKKDLINQHLLETSSGSEVMKRLLSKKLIKELPYEKDKRAKLVSLTPLGVETIMKSFDEMHRVAEIIIGNLSDEELKESLIVFNKLNDFHQQIHKDNRDTSLMEIHTKYITKTYK